MESLSKVNSPKGNIIFTNEPKLSRHEVDKTRNEKRLELPGQIKEFISHNDRFKNRDARVSFAQEGVASLVSIIEVEGKKSVLKIPLHADHNEEGRFLKAWESAGVSVPHVIEEGYIAGSPYLLMSYVDSPTLKEAYGSRENILANRVYVEIGKTLRNMHVPKTTGYGYINNGMPEYSNFNDWLDSDSVQNRIKLAEETGLLTDKHGSIDIALETFRSNLGKETESSYCHSDLDPGNIFATDPLTVFDPVPALNHPYIDLGLTITIGASLVDGEEVYKQIIEGYFPNEKDINKELLHSSILLASYSKFRRWYKIKNETRIKSIQEFLVKLYK
jgi:fructosamine-3-kinase